MLPSGQPEPGQAPTLEPVAPDAVWESLFASLAGYKQQHGHFRIALAAGNELLALWVAQQKKQWLEGTMPPAKRQRLEAIGFPGTMRLHPAVQGESVDKYVNLGPIIKKWEKDRVHSQHLEREWQEKYNELKEFRIRFGHCYVPHPWPEQPGLGAWVQTQREQLQAGTLDADRIALLNKLDFIWTGGWEVLGDDWRQKQKEVMGRFYHGPEARPDHYTLPQYRLRLYLQEPVEPESDGIEI